MRGFGGFARIGPAWTLIDGRADAIGGAGGRLARLEAAVVSGQRGDVDVAIVQASRREGERRSDISRSNQNPAAGDVRVGGWNGVALDLLLVDIVLRDDVVDVAVRRAVAVVTGGEVSERRP